MCAGMGMVFTVVMVGLVLPPLVGVAVVELGTGAEDDPCGVELAECASCMGVAGPPLPKPGFLYDSKALCRLSLLYGSSPLPLPASLKYQDRQHNHNSAYLHQPPYTSRAPTS